LLGINTLILTISLLIVELLFGRWLKQDPVTAIPEIARTAGKAILFRTDGVTGENVLVDFSRDHYGLRGLESTRKPLALVLGGSTGIEQNVPLALTWAERVESQLQASDIHLEIANASISGHTLFGNAFAVDQWLSRIPVDPSLFIVYYGHNDAVYTLAGIPPQGRDFSSGNGFDLVQYINANSALLILARELKGNYQSLVTGNRHLYDYKPSPLPSETESHPLRVPPIATVAVGQLYKAAISNLIRTFEGHYRGKTVIFVAQSNPTCRFSSPGLYYTLDGSRNILCERLAAFHRYVSSVISELNSKPSTRNTYRYIPLYLHNPYDRSGASDYIHTNSRGALGIANQLMPLLRGTLMDSRTR
jgi:lysophospholipase L1-like esterase